MNSDNKTNSKNKAKKQNDSKQVKQNNHIIKNKKVNNAERAKLDDMNQIDWFPVDPYCD